METGTRTPTATELRAEGFTSDQIARLSALRAEYPIVEIIDSQRGMQQLRFLKWRYATGRIGG